MRFQSDFSAISVPLLSSAPVDFGARPREVRPWGSSEPRQGPTAHRVPWHQGPRANPTSDDDYIQDGFVDVFLSFPVFAFLCLPPRGSTTERGEGENCVLAGILCVFDDPGDFLKRFPCWIGFGATTRQSS